MKGVNMNKKKSEKREGSLTIRTFIIYVCVVLISIGIFYRIIDLQYFQKDNLVTISENFRKTLKMVDIPVERGIIFSCNGDVLVQRITKYTIGMDMYSQNPPSKKDGSIQILVSDEDFNNNVVALADSLTALFGQQTPSWEDMLRKARAEKQRNFIISKNVSIPEYNRVLKFPILGNIGKYNALIANKKEIPETPYGKLALRTLGTPPDTLKNDTLGIGLEGRFNKELSGTPGRVLRRYISHVPIDVESDKNIKPIEGYDIITTLDMTVQDIATKALENALRTYEAAEGCAVVMKVKTGDILAMVNLKRNESKEYKDNLNIALINYQPGSTFKTAALLVALNDEKVTPNTLIPINYKDKSITEHIGDRDVTDYHNIRKKNPELWEVFAQSSNVGTVRAIYDNYVSNQQKFIDGLYKLGFGDTLHFPIIGGDIKPLLRGTSDPRWSKMSISTIPFGYEVEVTPLHLLTFYNAIANDGCMVAPRLVTKIISKDSIIRKYNVDTLYAQICSKQALQYIRGMLDSVITNGTGRNGFRNVPYTVAGKTGTANDQTHDGLENGYRNLSFCGYFPADKPKYSCVVVAKKTKMPRIAGGTVAIPVFRDIADKIYAMDHDLIPEAKAMSQNADIASIPISAKVRSKTLETIFNGINFNAPVSSATEWIKIYSAGQQLYKEDVSFSKNVIPDVTGMSLTDAVYILEKAGIATEVKGYGRVKRQSPEANTPLKKNQKVILELNIDS